MPSNSYGGADCIEAFVKDTTMYSKTWQDHNLSQMLVGCFHRFSVQLVLADHDRGFFEVSLETETNKTAVNYKM